MNANDTYRAWVEKRRAVETDEDFASTVMARIRVEDVRATEQGGPSGGRWLAVAACVIGAMVVALFRGLSTCLALLAVSGHTS